MVYEKGTYLIDKLHYQSYTLSLKSLEIRNLRRTTVRNAVDTLQEKSR